MSVANDSAWTSTEPHYNDYYNHINNSSDYNISNEYDSYYHAGEYYHHAGEDYYYGFSYYLEIFPFEIVTMGYVRPILVFLTILANLFVCGYFLAKKTRGKASSLLFVSIALSDTMAGVSLLPNSLGIYAADYTDVSREWCLSYMILRLYVSRVFHTVSVWQTVILSIQRYMSVCHPILFDRVCTFWKTLICIGLSYVFTAILHVYHVVDNKLEPGTMRCLWKLEHPCTGTCVYLWVSEALHHLIPCIILLSLTIKTILELNKTPQHASTSQNNPISATQVRRDRIVTITTIVIVVCLLIPELPFCIYNLALMVQHHVGEKNILTPERKHIIFFIYEIILLVSFSANFWIYCAMIHDFRRKMVQIVACEKIRRHQSVSRQVTCDTSSHERIPLHQLNQDKLDG